MKTLLVVDGHHLLFKMFYGMPSRIIGKNGKSVHAIIGFTGALLKVINMTRPTEIVVVFDSENGSDRNQLNPEYKGNRVDYTDVPTDDNPFSQLNDIYIVLDYLRIKHFESFNGNEADDHITSYVNSYKNTHKVYILSGDTDFMQLVDENVNLFVYRGKKSIVYNREMVYEKFGIYPNYFADYKCLVGDKSDNIKGVPTVGPKTATSLIDTYGGILNIIKSIELVRKTTLKMKLKEYTDMLIQNYQLIKLDRKIDNPYEGESLLWSSKDMKTLDILRSLDYM
ncbi:flap endonuclease [Mycoplasmatota bacterium]|nr:flap endonuclease [Mycoplasmatota bacterium]